ncbi:hypothetical protein KM043_008189 [Ampulex compressa]|nr:hypothetical protein KM043_008189 [Ampulex compressa]
MGILDFLQRCRNRAAVGTESPSPFLLLAFELTGARGKYGAPYKGCHRACSDRIIRYYLFAPGYRTTGGGRPDRDHPVTRRRIAMPVPPSFPSCTLSKGVVVLALGWAATTPP